MSGLRTLLNVLEMRLGPPKHPQIDWIWTESHRLGTSKTSSNRLDLDRNSWSKPYRFEGRSPWLSVQILLRYLRVRLGIWTHRLGPSKHPQIDEVWTESHRLGHTKRPQIDRIWTETHGPNPHRFEGRSLWLSIQTPRLYLIFRLGIYINSWTKQVVLAWSVL